MTMRYTQVILEYPDGTEKIINVLNKDYKTTTPTDSNVRNIESDTVNDVDFLHLFKYHTHGIYYRRPMTRGTKMMDASSSSLEILRFDNNDLPYGTMIPLMFVKASYAPRLKDGTCHVLGECTDDPYNLANELKDLFSEDPLSQVLYSDGSIYNYDSNKVTLNITSLHRVAGARIESTKTLTNFIEARFMVRKYRGGSNVSGALMECTNVLRLDGACTTTKSRHHIYQFGTYGAISYVKSSQNYGTNTTDLNSCHILFMMFIDKRAVPYMLKCAHLKHPIDPRVFTLLVSSDLLGNTPHKAVKKHFKHYVAPVLASAGVNMIECSPHIISSYAFPRIYLPSFKSVKEMNEYKLKHIKRALAE